MFYQTYAARSHAVHCHHPLAAMEWSCLLLHDVVCSERVTMRHAVEQTIRLLPGVIGVHSAFCPL